MWATRELDASGQLVNEQHFKFAEHLAELQAHTAIILVLPEMVSAEVIAEVAATASILRGETVVTEHTEIAWVGPDADFAAIKTAAANGTTVQSVRPLTATVGGATIPLGAEGVRFSSIEISTHEPADEGAVKATFTARVEEVLVSPTA